MCLILKAFSLILAFFLAYIRSWNINVYIFAKYSSFFFTQKVETSTTTIVLLKSEILMLFE